MIRTLVALVLFCGIAAAEDLFFDKVGLVDEFPRAVARGRTLTLKGLTKGAYKNPELLIIGADRRCYKVYPETSNESGFHYIVRFEHGVGRYRMELIAHAPKTTRSFARFDVWYGKRKPANYKAPPLPDGPAVPRELHPRLIETRIFRQLNEARRELRLRPMAWNEAVAARTRSHAINMAKVRKRLHRFGRSGSIQEMLALGGSGDDLSGSREPWSRLTNRRPFDPPQVQSPSSDVRNHVVVFLHDDFSIEKMLERAYGREAAHRICSVDPNTVEVAIGVAWPARPKKVPPFDVKANGRKYQFYACICFIQVNDKTIIKRQDDAFRALKREAGKLHPDHIRRLAWWRRPRLSLSLFKSAARHRDPIQAGAAFDALLLVDEPAARSDLVKLGKNAERLIQDGRYAEAIVPWRLAHHVIYDRRIPNTVHHFERQVRTAVLAELKALPEDFVERVPKLRNLARRTKGTAIHEMVIDKLGQAEAGAAERDQDEGKER